jgi:VWFA-related protein
VVLALDMSESVAGARLAQLQSASGALLSALKPGDQSALVTFSQQVRLAAPLSTNLSFVRLALDTASSAGGTALADAVYAAMVVGESEAGRALLIVFSDGVDTASWLTDERITEMAKRSNAVIYAVCVPSITRPELLGELTSLTGGRLREIEKTQNLPQVFLSILEEFRQRYLLSYTPRGVSKNGWHRLDVRVKGRRVAVKARPGYLGGS